MSALPRLSLSARDAVAEHLAELYERLGKRFGPQRWWPGETPFEVMVGAILTQNTNWKNVERALAHLAAAGGLEPRALAALAPARLAELIRPAGFYRLKARRVRAFLDFFLERYDGDVERMRARDAAALRGELLAVRGIGPETADAILLYALEKPVFVVDAYTHRVLLRHGWCDETADYDELQQLFMQRIAPDVAVYGEYHALIVAVGKECCRPEPRCRDCPLNGLNWAQPRA